MIQNNQTHEKFSSPAEVKAGSDRVFGLVFAMVFVLIALVPMLKGHGARWWAFVVASIFFVIALVAPKILFPLNRLWFRFGLVLHKIVSPVVLGLVFFAVFTPFSLIVRALGKRPLVLGFDNTVPTYWIVRTPPGPASQSMTQQF